MAGTTTSPSMCESSRGADGKRKDESLALELRTCTAESIIGMLAKFAPPECRQWYLFSTRADCTTLGMWGWGWIGAANRNFECLGALLLHGKIANALALLAALGIGSTMRRCPRKGDRSIIRFSVVHRLGPREPSHSSWPLEKRFT